MLYILVATIVLIGIANYLDRKNGHSKDIIWLQISHSMN